MAQFSDSTIAYISDYSVRINSVARILGVSSAAIAGAIAEEFDSFKGQVSRVGHSKMPIEGGPEVNIYFSTGLLSDLATI